MKTFDDVLSAELKELFSAQRQWLLALPGMIRGSSNGMLAEHFRREARETKRHIERIEEIAGMLGGSPRGRVHAPMRELVQMANEIPSSEADRVISDARLIIVAQRVAHLLICGYGTARTLARILGHEAVEASLATSLAEKDADDRALTNLAIDLYTVSGPAEAVAPLLDEPFRP
jgi:ferritin-like metal-binding protein YciE